MASANCHRRGRAITARELTARIKHSLIFLTLRHSQGGLTSLCRPGQRAKVAASRAAGARHLPQETS